MGGLTDYYRDVLGVQPERLEYIDDDFVAVRLEDSDRIFVLAFGDPVRLVDQNDAGTTFEIVGGRFHGARARGRRDIGLRDQPILRFSTVDVQQGDGMILETPDGRVVFIDGGDNKLFARHVAARFTGTSPAKPLRVDAMIVTHGDADHFAGLAEIKKSETLKDINSQSNSHKRVFIEVARVLHNGLVKRPDRDGDKARNDRDMFGPVHEQDGVVHITGLVENLLAVGKSEMNKHFQQWQAALTHWQKRAVDNGRKGIEFHRVDHTSRQAFSFLTDAGLTIDLHGPIVETIGGGPALLFLNEPDKETELHLSREPAVGRALSASHTINGHSIAFRLGFRNVRFCLTGDLNQQAMARLRRNVPGADFEAEILKAPHHGSADFDMSMLRSVKPVVSIISSGDESARTEHIHPRATLVSALGKVSRGDTGIIFCTELAAFFAVRGYASVLKPKANGKNDAKPFFAFERTNFGIVHVRTDGRRVLAFTHSGKAGVNEGYGFTVDGNHVVTFASKLRMVSAPPKRPAGDAAPRRTTAAKKAVKAASKAVKRTAARKKRA